MKVYLSAVTLLMAQLSIFAQEAIYNFDSTATDTTYGFSTIPVNPTFAGTSDNMFKDGMWSNEYSIPGIRGTIYSTATDGTNLYVGGNFRIAGNITALNIAKWDGVEWSSVGEGDENGVYGDIPSVHALAFAGGKLFAGGQFSRAGKTNVNLITYFDGEKWNRLGSDSINGVRQIFKMENDTMVVRGFVWSLFADNDKI